MIKSTGIVRKVDELGRIVIPMELRKTMEIGEKDPLEIYVDGNGSIILKKYAPGCMICHGNDSPPAANFGTKYMCADCLATANTQRPPATAGRA